MKKIYIFLAGVLVTLGAVYLLSNRSEAPSTSNSTSNGTTNQSTSSDVVADYSNKGLTQFPKEVLSKTSTTVLYLQRNQLTGAMPAEIKNLKNLTTLDASYNNMTGVPAEVGQLSNLKILNLSYNQLTGLPNELGNLKQLQTLDLRGNNASQQDVQKIKDSLPSTTVLL